MSPIIHWVLFIVINGTIMTPLSYKTEAECNIVQERLIELSQYSLAPKPEMVSSCQPHLHKQKKQESENSKSVYTATL